MPYLYHTDDDRRQMLEALGMGSLDELFAKIPEGFRLSEPLPIGMGRTEHETLQYFETLASRNRPAGSTTSFLGGGIYDSLVPSVIKHLAGRSEFYTAYTPYQAEVSQGTLQVIYEYQTQISRLTALPVANASMYDGATALAEAALMAAKITRRSQFLCAANMNPRYRAVLDTYTAGQGLTLEEVPVTDGGDVDAKTLVSLLGDNTAAVIVQTPNYYGVLECPWEYREAVRDSGALLVASVDPSSLAIFQPPGEYDADIATGEAQTLGNDMNFGGPLLGFMACKSDFVRSLPGRLVSETRDIDGKRAYVLTLQTREQHIRREKATSNICTNQGLLALRTAIYLSVLGEAGFLEVGRICHQKAHELAERISKCKGYSLRYSGPFFREFVVRCPVDAMQVVETAHRHDILAGVPMAKYFGDTARNELLVSVSEKRTEPEFDKFCKVLESV